MLTYCKSYKIRIIHKHSLKISIIFVTKDFESNLTTIQFMFLAKVASEAHCKFCQGIPAKVPNFKCST